MKMNPLKIGKHTFWLSFIIGNLFLFGFLFGVPGLALYSAILGYYYLFVATFINIAILLILLAFGIFGFCNVEKKECFIGIGIMLINIPLAVLYAFIGISLVDCFNL